MELKKGNYYEIFCRKFFGLNSKEYRVVKYLGNNVIKYLDTHKELELDETNTTFATKAIREKEIAFVKDYFGFRRISIMPIHLERLGFEKKEGTLYEHSNGLKIFYGLSTLGFDSKYIGSIVSKEEELNTIIEKIDVSKLEEKYSKKFDDIEKLVKENLQKENCIYLPLEYTDTKVEFNIELHNMIINAMVGTEEEQKDKKNKPIHTIEELFERLEQEGMIIEDKDKIVLE